MTEHIEPTYLYALFTPNCFFQNLCDLSYLFRYRFCRLFSPSLPNSLQINCIMGFFMPRPKRIWTEKKKNTSYKIAKTGRRFHMGEMEWEEKERKRVTALKEYKLYTTLPHVHFRHLSHKPY